MENAMFVFSDFSSKELESTSSTIKQAIKIAKRQWVSWNSNQSEWLVRWLDSLQYITLHYINIYKYISKCVLCGAQTCGSQ